MMTVIIIVVANSCCKIADCAPRMHSSSSDCTISPQKFWVQTSPLLPLVKLGATSSEIDLQFLSLSAGTRDWIGLWRAKVEVGVSICHRSNVTLASQPLRPERFFLQSFRVETVQGPPQPELSLEYHLRSLRYPDGAAACLTCSSGFLACAIAIIERTKQFCGEP